MESEGVVYRGRRVSGCFRYFLLWGSLSPLFMLVAHSVRYAHVCYEDLLDDDDIILVRKSGEGVSVGVLRSACDVGRVHRIMTYHTNKVKTFRSFNEPLFIPISPPPYDAPWV